MAPKPSVATRSPPSPTAEREGLLRELPGQIRYRLAGFSAIPDELAAAAEALREALNVVDGQSGGTELRSASARLIAQVSYCEDLLARVTLLAGELRGLGWAADARGDGG